MLMLGHTLEKAEQLACLTPVLQMLHALSLYLSLSLSLSVRVSVSPSVRPSVVQDTAHRCQTLDGNPNGAQLHKD